MSTKVRWIVGAGVAVLLAGAAAGAALVLVGSGDGDGGGAVDGGGGPRAGGRLRIALTGLATLDPARAVDPVEIMMADHLFDTLVTYDPDTLEVEPGIARSWEASDDQQRFTFRLRDDAVFHDGSPVTAADVKATLERVAAPAVGSRVGFLLELVGGYEALVAEPAPAEEGGGEGEEGAGEDAPPRELTGVVVEDERTVSIELSAPFADFPAVLGNPRLGILPADAGHDELGEGLVGSGPLELVELTDDRVRLRRFDDYSPRATWVEGVDVEIRDSVEAAYSRLGNDRADLAPVPADRVGQAAVEYGEAGLGPFLGVLFYGMNLGLEEFGDVRAREAIVHAVDTGRIIDVAYGSTLEPAPGLVPAQVPGASDDPCGDRCRHDPARARELLREVFPDGEVPTVSIDFDEDPRQRLVASAIKDDLEAVGVPAELRPHRFADFGRVLVSDDKELFRLGWIPDFPSPDAFLYPLFVTDLEDNLTGLSDEEIDETLRAARAEPDPEVRAGLYREAEQLILARFPVLPIAQFNNRWAAGRGVGGFEMTPMGTFDVVDVFLRGTAEAEV